MSTLIGSVLLCQAFFATRRRSLPGHVKVQNGIPAPPAFLFMRWRIVRRRAFLLSFMFVILVFIGIAMPRSRNLYEWCVARSFHVVTRVACGTFFMALTREVWSRRRTGLLDEAD
jgi:hypothetical protein